MALLRGLEFPDGLFYHAHYMVWLRPEADGAVTLGLTALARATAGDLLIFTPKRIGAEIERDRSVGNVETGKTVSSVRSPIAGVLIAANEAVEKRPTLINSEPYSAWLVRLRPTAWEADSARLATGAAALTALAAEMNLYHYTGS
ncbi:MAG: glycine cleavage system protein H [Gammaproteobacteria bacterium]